MTAQTLRDRIAARRQERGKPFALETPIEGVWVSYKPIPSGKLEDIHRRRKKEKAKGRGLAINIDVLIDACVGVHERIDGELVSIDPDNRDGEALTFTSPRLLELLGVESQLASDAVRELYAVTDDHDGDVITAANEVMHRSGLAAAVEAEEMPGE